MAFEYTSGASLAMHSTSPRLPLRGQNEAITKLRYTPLIPTATACAGGGVGDGYFGDYYSATSASRTGSLCENREPRLTPTAKAHSTRTATKYRPTPSASAGRSHASPPENKEICLCLVQGRRTSEAILSRWYSGGLARHTALSSFIGLQLLDAKKDFVVDIDLTRINILHSEDEITLPVETAGEAQRLSRRTGL